MCSSGNTFQHLYRLWSNNTKVTDLDIADDVAIQSESLETLVVALDAFINEGKPLGQEVSWIEIMIPDRNQEILFSKYMLLARMLKPHIP